MGILDLLHDPTQTPEQIFANEQVQWLLQKGLSAENIQDDAITAALVDPGAPNAPTSLTLTGSGTYQDNKQGMTRAYVTLSWMNPTANFGDAVVLYRQSGQTTWMHATRTTGTTARIEGLECGLNYDFGVQAVSQFNVAGAVASLTTQLMPGDPDGPSAPGTPTIVDKKLTTITFGWAASASTDTGGYEAEIRTAASGGGSQVWTGTVDSTFATVDQATIGFGVTRYFRVRGLDYTKNAGSWTSDVSFSFVKAVTADIGALQVTQSEIADTSISTVKIIGEAVTTPKRQALSTLSQSVSVAANSDGQYAFAHNLGVRASFSIRVTGTWNGKVATTQYNGTTTEVNMNVWNGHPTDAVSGTLYVDYW